MIIQSKLCGDLLVRAEMNLVILARRHRFAVGCMVVSAVVFPLVMMHKFRLLTFPLEPVLILVNYVVFFANAWAVASLTDAMNRQITNPHYWWMIAILPGIQVLAIVVLLLKARNVFRSMGIEVPFWGVRESRIRKQIDGLHCRRCLYDLTGNTSGVCPECGEVI